MLLEQQECSIYLAFSIYQRSSATGSIYTIINPSLTTYFPQTPAIYENLGCFFFLKRSQITLPAYDPSVPLKSSVVFDNFQPVSLSNVTEVFTHLKPSLCSPDIIPTRLFKEVFDTVQPSGLFMINIWLLSNRTNLNPTVLSNFSPISKVPFLSKVPWTCPCCCFTIQCKCDGSCSKSNFSMINILYCNISFYLHLYLPVPVFSHFSLCTPFIGSLWLQSCLLFGPPSLQCYFYVCGLFFSLFAFLSAYPVVALLGSFSLRLYIFFSYIFFFQVIKELFFSPPSRNLSFFLFYCQGFTV